MLRVFSFYIIAIVGSHYWAASEVKSEPVLMKAYEEVTKEVAMVCAVWIIVNPDVHMRLVRRIPLDMGELEQPHVAVIVLVIDLLEIFLGKLFVYWFDHNEDSVGEFVTNVKKEFSVLSGWASRDPRQAAAERSESFSASQLSQPDSAVQRQTGSTVLISCAVESI